MVKDLIKIYQDRRSIYDLGTDIPLSSEEIVSLICDCVKHAPSAFNSQSGRVVILFSAAHHKLWNIVLSNLQKVTPADKFAATTKKIASFAAAAGTILFFEDEDTIGSLQKQYPLYKDAFPLFSAQSSGMLQYMIWTALSSEGIGASLQHYNPLIDEDVTKEWHLPQSWKLYSQMPFGKIKSAAGDKEFMSISERVKVFG